MAIVTIGEILDRGRDFETRLEAYYAEIRDCSTDNGVRLLTYYLARHRRHQEQALAGLDTETLRHVRAVELKFGAPFDAFANLRIPDLAPAKVTGDGLIETAIRYDGELVALYRTILGQPLSDEARAVLEALIRVEERDIVMLKKMLAMHYF
jgi:hypothetical protein